MLARPCSRAVCSRDATATLTYDYRDQMAVLGPLSGTRVPNAYDLCAIHAERTTAPQGWQVVRYEVLAEERAR